MPFVTHDIDETLFLSDVVYAMTARPGRIKQEIVVDIRARADPMSCPRRASSRSNAKCLALVREEAMAALAEAEPLPAG